MPETTTTERLNHRRRKTGLVTSDKMQKTIVVQVSYKVRHRGLGKVTEHFKKFKAHDEKNEAKTGDLVEIEETRPLSRWKTWRLIKIVTKGAQPVQEPEIA